MKGNLTDRPWAATLDSISNSNRSGQLTVKSDGKVYQVAFANGQVVGAVSPVPCDSVQRIALTNHLMPPASVAAAVRIMGRNDDVDKFTESAGLTGEAASRFKRRVLVQRTARTFALERGEYVLEDRITIPVLKQAEIDVRAAIFYGMRMNVSDLRLSTELRQLGSWFILYPEQASHLEKFDFDVEAGPIITALRGGTCVAELDALHRELDPRLVLAVVTSLATCNVIAPIESRVPQPRAPEPKPVQQQMPYLAKGSRSNISRPSTAGFEGDKTVMLPPKMSQKQIRQLITSRLAMLEGGTDLFTFLGVPFGATPQQVRAAYLEIARYLRPERLAEQGIHDDRDEARTVFAQAVIAMTTLTNDQRRASYISSFAREARARS